MVWFAMLAALLILGGLAYALPLYGMQPAPFYNFARMREGIELGGVAIFIAAIYVRFKFCSLAYLLRKLKRLPLTSSGMSRRLNHHDYSLRLAPKVVRRFNSISTGEQRIFFVYSTYFKNLIYALALVQAYALVGFSVSALSGDFAVAVPYIGLAAVFNVLFLLPATGTPEMAVTKARAKGLINNL